MQSLKNINLCNDIHSYPIEDELILFDRRSAQLFHLNTIAALIWKGLQAGCSKHEIIRTLARSTGNSAEQIDRDTEDLFRQWHSLGLIGKHTWDLEAQLYDEASNLPIFELGENEIIPEPSASSLQLCFHIIDTHIRLKVPSKKELSRVEPIVSHLMIESGVECDVELSIVQTNQRYFLLIEGKPIDWCKGISGLAPMVHANAAFIAYDRAKCFLGLHAAAVCYRERCFLIPAVSGSGKSTLTAALIGSGFEYCADDLVLLTNPPIEMRPVPIAIGLKTGSWIPIENFHPKMASLPTHLRTDGKKVRYLTPSEGSIQWIRNKNLAVDFILFPRFDEESQGTLFKKLSAGEGLCKLTEAGYDISGQLTAEKIRQLIDWIVDIPNYEIRFNQLDDIISAIRSLVI